MDSYPWARLAPLPEAVVASMTLGSLLGIESRLPIGWAPVGLMLATWITARRPGSELWIEQRKGALRFNATGGTLLGEYDPIGPPTSSWINASASRICELCGRPAQYRHNPPGARCDACESLRGQREAARLSFEPRLPITEEAEEARKDLLATSSLKIPAGWSRQVRSTIRDLSPAAGTSFNYTIIPLADRVTMYLLDGDADDFQFLTERLEASTLAICQHCGRVAENDRYPGICDGCRSVQAREYKILPAYDDGRRL